MKIKASGRSALIIATGILVCLAAPLPAMATGSDTTAASKSDSATAGKSTKQSSRHAQRYATRKSSKVAATSTETKKVTDPATADADGVTPSAIPASVANANAELTSADAPADSASAMSAKANTMLQAAADKPADAQAAPPTDVVASDQLNDVDRALQQGAPSPQANPPAAPTVAVAPAKVAPVLASSSDSSTWDQTSLIGKVFIGFGALLTMASAARMFMA
jgi:hypothetical protein